MVINIIILVNMVPAQGCFEPSLIAAWILPVQPSSWKIYSPHGVGLLGDLYRWSEIDCAADFLGATY
uniref:Uncharacterized protein n=1 Tax=Picea sitchensis TaxID=3332 RepID=A9NM39_PICSI|nr:unknown [Picea sitchensis]